MKRFLEAYCKILWKNQEILVLLCVVSLANYITTETYSSTIYSSLLPFEFQPFFKSITWISFIEILIFVFFILLDYDFLFVIFIWEDLSTTSEVPIYTQWEIKIWFIESRLRNKKSIKNPFYLFLFYNMSIV